MKLIQTEDGSHTLYVAEIDETYHSTFGAVQESQHIFIDTGLRKCVKSDIELLEIGFGTGLNAYLTMIYAVEKGINVHYHTFELYPIDDTLVAELNFTSRYGMVEDFVMLHKAEWGIEVVINDNFSITKHRKDFTRIDCLPCFDVCYFDAFSPDKQPDMWGYDRFELLYRRANSSAILTTYCAKGQVRRHLQQAGFGVERLSGPKGKREILRATK